MLAVAVGYASTGVLAGIGAVLAGFAAGLSAGQSLRILDTELRITEALDAAKVDLQTLSGAQRATAFMGGGRTG